LGLDIYLFNLDSEVKLEIYNISGHRVRELVNGIQELGRHRIQWNATNDHGQSLPW